MSQLYLIKDLSRLTGHSIHTIKFYLKIGLLKEAGRFPQTNFRYFNKTTQIRLEKIRQLRREGRSLKEIQLILKK